MLPGENDPFADHHIAELTKILDLIHPEKTPDPEAVQKLNDEEIYVIVREARQALVRYKICFADEVRQKTLYRDRWLALKPKL